MIASTYRVALEWVQTDFGGSATNVIHVHKSGSDAATIAAAIDGSVVTNMWAGLGTHAYVSQLNITPLDGTGVTFPYSTGHPAKWTGSITSNQVIPQACIVVKLLTAKRGRSYRGRLYLPWCEEQTNTNGIMDSSTKPTMNTAWVAFHTALTAAGVDWVVASYKLATQEPVIAVAVENSLGTQRRRLHRTSAP